jgi:hypothetical protein
MSTSPIVKLKWNELKPLDLVDILKKHPGSIPQDKKLMFGQSKDSTFLWGQIDEDASL